MHTHIYCLTVTKTNRNDEKIDSMYTNCVHTKWTKANAERRSENPKDRPRVFWMLFGSNSLTTTTTTQTNWKEEIFTIYYDIFREYFHIYTHKTKPNAYLQRIFLKPNTFRFTLQQFIRSYSRNKCSIIFFSNLFISFLFVCLIVFFFLIFEMVIFVF